MVRFDLALVGGVVADASYQAFGCPATLAAAAWTARHVIGSSFLAAAGVGSDDVLAGAGLPPGKATFADTAVDALHAALGAIAVSEAGLTPDTDAGEPDGVLVGMSGGVDSAVAALLAKGRGSRVVGVTLTLWRENGASGERSCCMPDAARRARRVAHGLGIPHLTVDASDLFTTKVVRYFVEEHSGGRTPNPCAKCNARVRFGIMLALARRLGLSFVATGHYARLAGDGRSLSRGSDGHKDQSYVLAEVDPDTLRSVIFPLAEMTKSEVRRLAAEAGLEGHSAPESQEICFVSDNDHRRFLRERLGERPGRVLNLQALPVGRHQGVYNYTIGQRKGLGIAAAVPMYVVSVDAVNNDVYVGPAEALDVGEVTITEVVWHRSRPEGSILLQVRSAGAPAPGRLVVAGLERNKSHRPDRVRVRLLEPLRGVARGQTAVVYSGSDVICAGTIEDTAGHHAGNHPQE